MEKLKKYLLMFSIFGIAILAFSIVAHEANAATYTWKGTSSTDASVNTNWNPSNVPTATDNVQFTSSYSNPCNFNLVQVANFSLLSGYTSTVTQGSNNIVSSFYMTGGTFTGNILYIFTDSGNFIKTGTLTNYVLNLRMTGISILSLDSSPYFRSLDIVGNVNWAGTATNIYFYNIAETNIGLSVSGTLAIGTGRNIWTDYPSATVITGIINGLGNLYQRPTSGYSQTAFTGHINCNLHFYLHDGGSSSTVTLLGDLIVYSSLIIESGDATHTLTLNLNAHNLAATNITVSSRGILSGSSGTITISNNWDSFAGTFISGTSSVVFTGLGNTKTAALQSFYNLDTTSTAVRTITSNIWVTHHKGINGTLSHAGYYENISSTIPCPLSIYDGAVFSEIYLNGTGTGQTVFYQLNMPGYIYCKNTVHYYSRSMNITIYGVDTSYVGFKGEDMTYPYHYEFYIKYGLISHVINFQIVGLYPLGQYDIKFNSVHSQYIGCDYNGTTNFFMTGPWQPLTAPIGSEIILDQVITGNTTTTSNVNFNLDPAMLLLAIAFTILGILTYASFKDKTFFVINGFAWIFVAAALINPIQYTLSLIALFIGIAFALWGVYRFIKG